MPLVQTGYDRYRNAIWAGTLRPWEPVYDFATVRDVRAIDEAALRPTFIAYAIRPERFVGMSWSSAPGSRYEARSIDALSQAIRDGLLLQRDRVRIRTTEWWVEVPRDELVAVVWPPQQSSEPSWFARNWPALVFGGLAVAAGATALVVHVRDARTVDVRDAEERHAIWKRDGRRCQICGARLTLGHMHLDHKEPAARGGESTWGNLQATHGPCNQMKGARTMRELDDWLRRG